MVVRVGDDLIGRAQLAAVQDQVLDSIAKLRLIMPREVCCSQMIVVDMTISKKLATPRSALYFHTDWNSELERGSTSVSQSATIAGFSLPYTES